MAEEASLEVREDRKEAALHIDTYLAAQTSGFTDALDARYLALSPAVLLIVGEVLRNPRFKQMAILAMTPDEFLEVGLSEWTTDDMTNFWYILRRGVPEEPIYMFGMEFPMADVTIRTRDGDLLYARHMVLCRSSRILGKMVRITDEGRKILDLPKEVHGVREVLHLLHNTAPPQYDTSYCAQQLEFLHNFAHEYEVPRIKELLTIEHLSLDFSKTRGPHDVVVIGISERMDLDEEEKNYRLYADYDTLCRSSPKVARQIYQNEGHQCFDVNQDRLFAHLLLKMLHDPRCTASDLNFSPTVLGRMHKFAMAMEMSRVVHLVETRLRTKPDSGVLAMLVKNTAGSLSLSTESLKVYVIETMPFDELRRYLDLHGRDIYKGVRNFTALMKETCQRRFDAEYEYYDWESLTKTFTTPRKEYKSLAFRNHVSRRDSFVSTRF